MEILKPDTSMNETLYLINSKIVGTILRRVQTFQVSNFQIGVLNWSKPTF